MTPSRRAMLAAGVGIMTLSLALSIAPALAANPNGNSGTVKIHDATTGLEAEESANEPMVCDFWVGFYASDPSEAGAWQLLSWPPTGDRTVVDSGTYDTTGVGEDTTGVLSPGAGHYRFEWQANEDSNTKHKLLWVVTDCDEALESDPSAEADPSEGPADDPVDEELVDEELVDEELVDEEPIDEEPIDEELVDEPASDPATPTADDELPAIGDEQDVLSGNPQAPSPAPAAETGPSAGAGTMLPDTALPNQSAGMLAALGLLLIVGAHIGLRRERSVDERA